MLRALTAASVLVLGLTVVVAAQEDPIAARKNLMKGVGGATRTGGQMAKNEIPFDLAKAREVLQAYAVAAERVPTLYPENAKTGGETSASPAIWERNAEFRAQFAAWARDIETAKDKVKDAETFRAEFGTLTKACGSCHQTFRMRT